MEANYSPKLICAWDLSRGNQLGFINRQCQEVAVAYASVSALGLDLHCTISASLSPERMLGTAIFTHSGSISCFRMAAYYCYALRAHSRVVVLSFVVAEPSGTHHVH